MPGCVRLSRVRIQLIVSRIKFGYLPIDLTYSSCTLTFN